jgi:hypothetical protein
MKWKSASGPKDNDERVVVHFAFFPRYCKLEDLWVWLEKVRTHQQYNKGYGYDHWTTMRVEPFYRNGKEEG